MRLGELEESEKKSQIAFLEDMDELVAKMSCANDKLKMLRIVFEGTYSKL